jgi:methionine-gamma-lyase
MISLQTWEGKQTARRLTEKLRIIHYAVSLDHHRSLIFYLHTKELLAGSFKFAAVKQLDSWRVFAGGSIFRLSAGLEDADDLTAGWNRPWHERSPCLRCAGILPLACSTGLSINRRREPSG